MTRIIFEQPDGSDVTVEAAEGRSLMEVAQEAGVEGIVAECGGSAACATCHVVLEPGVYEQLDAPEVHEEDMLDFVDAPREAGSRLSCQLRVTALFDGARVRVPTA